MEFDDVLATATPVTKAVPLCLAGELQAEWEDLDRRRKAIKAGPASDSLAGAGGEARAVEERMDAIREEMDKATVTFRVKGLPKRRWSNLAAEHPPRPEDKEEGLDYNAETFPLAALVACCVDPVMTLKQAERLVDEVLTQGQWDGLWVAVMLANTRRVDVPKSVSASV